MPAARKELAARSISTPMPNWKLIAFYLGIPLIIAVYGAINNWEVQQSIGFGGTLAFYLSHSFVPWWITCLCTYGLMQLLRRWKPPAVLLMIAGAFVGCLLTIPYANWITAIFEGAWPTQSFDGFTTRALSTDFFIFYARVVAIWIAVNFVFDRYIGLPRYRYGPVALSMPDVRIDHGAPDDAAEPVAEPAFLARMPQRLRIADVIAISAEQHYIRIHTRTKEHMVLYRFSDAVREIDSRLGMQVHRSWWISRAAIESIRHGTKKFVVRLDSGLDVPVSTPYQGMLRELARNTNIPLRPLPASSHA